MTLPEAHREAWTVVASDVLSGNNVSEADVRFDGGPLDVTAEPAG
jgi:hypothetical protein